jgi:hypothetical protein
MDPERYKFRQSLWINFLTEWGGQFNQVKSLIKLINLYPERLRLVGLGNLYAADELDESQKEWLLLYSRLENPIETNYFKPYYVPINVDDFKVFVDLSDPGLLFIEPGYDFKGHYWNHLTRFESALELVAFLDSDNESSPPIDKRFCEHLDKLLKDIL